MGLGKSLHWRRTALHAPFILDALAYCGCVREADMVAKQSMSSKVTSFSCQTCEMMM